MIIMYGYNFSFIFEQKYLLNDFSIFVRFLDQRKANYKRFIKAQNLTFLLFIYLVLFLIVSFSSMACTIWFILFCCTPGIQSCAIFW